jgi:hypothetical protein
VHFFTPRQNRFNSYDTKFGVGKLEYRTRAIISRGLYIFYPNFYCGLYIRAVSITDDLCTKQGNSSIFERKVRGL